MYLSGSIHEMRSIFFAAQDLKASSIHCISPNIVFILAGNKKDYVFAKTTMTIGQSVLIPKASYTNMLIYIRNAVKRCKREPHPHIKQISTVLFTPGLVSFNESNLFSLEVNLPFYPLKKEVEFKIKESIQSSLQLDSPFLSIPAENIRDIQSAILQNKRQYARIKYTSECNAIRKEEEELVLSSTFKGRTVKTKMKIPEFSASEMYPDVSYLFSDRSFYLFRWLCRLTSIEEFSIIPRGEYSVIEGYAGGLAIKVRAGVPNGTEYEQV